jgi:polyribonucleotide 5'-hydroxyl-kinase
MADLDLFSGIQGVGAGGAGVEEQAPEHKKRWSLRQETELRFEVDPTELVVMKLLSGTAELFGSELPRGVDVVFQQGGSGAIFTWHGCDLEVSGQPAHIYVESDTTMKQTCAIHGVLDARRSRAREGGGAGPRVLIVGPPDSGKSTVTRLLLAYATRMQWAPTLVDLDLGAGFIGVPGSVGACSVRTPMELR